MTEGITARVAAVRARIEESCARSGRDPAGVTVIAVSKTFPVDAIEAAAAAGMGHFGENRVQEGVPKIETLRARGVTPVWHLVGHLQTNKARAAVESFDILHGVDSLRIAGAVSACATRPVRVLLQVNAAAEASKFGVSAAEAPAVAARIRDLPYIELLGLMTIAPRVDHPEDARAVFRAMRELRDELCLRDLSMGMTEDFEVAIEEGATLVRIGRAIFGERPA